MNYKPIASTASDTTVSTDSKVVMGWSFGASADAKIFIRDGDDANGRVIAVIYLLGGQSVVDHFGPVGIQFYDGVYVDMVSGTAEGCIWME